MELSIEKPSAGGTRRVRSEGVQRGATIAAPADGTGVVGKDVISMLQSGVEETRILRE
jgi:hypothetical protein